MNGNSRNYRAEFSQAVRDQLAAIERAMNVFNDHADHADDQFAALETRIAELRENDAELKQLILTQGAELRAQGAELRALRERLEGQ